MISILDIEASGFGSESYPIEIGVVTKTDERYCALIKPFPDWTHWDASAEKIHGVSRELLLKKGKPPEEVCFALNNLLKEQTIYCDAWVHDSIWLQTLFYRTAISPTFRLSAIESVASERQLIIWDQVKRETTNKLALDRHRASNDAVIIQKTYTKTYLNVQ